MDYFYSGDKAVDIKVPRNKGANVDTVTIHPSPSGMYQTNDAELVEAIFSDANPNKKLFSLEAPKVAEEAVPVEAEGKKKGKEGNK